MNSLRILMVTCALTLVAPAGVEARRRKRPDKHPTLSQRQKRKLAKEQFLQGKKEFSLGRFQQALQRFTRAYELVPLPGLLFNIGQCHRMMGNYKKALFFYRGFLTESPDSPSTNEVRRLIEESKSKLRILESKTAQERQAEQRRMAEEERRKVELERRKLELMKLKLTSQKTIVFRQPTKQRPRPPVYKRWWFWTAIGGGVAAVVATSVALSLTTTKTKTVLPSGGAGTIDFR